MNEPFRTLSWGCGTPSTTLGVLSALDHLPALDLIITSDTGWERNATYQAQAFYVEWFREKGIKVEVLGGQDIRKYGADRHIHIPFWTSNGGPWARECTRHFKIRPIRRRIREILGYPTSTPPHPPAGAVEKWLGYTWEEVGRQKKSDVAYVVKCYPLIDLRWTRDKCKQFLQSQGLPVPVKSACVPCPFRTAAEYLEMKAANIDEFDDAVAFDNFNRNNPLAERGASTADQLYVYRNPKSKRGEPLDQTDLEEAARWQSRNGKQMMLNMCDGPCMT